MQSLTASVVRDDAPISDITAAAQMKQLAVRENVVRT